MVTSGQDSFQIILQPVKEKGLRDLLGLGKQEKVYATAIQGGGRVPAPASRRTWQFRPLGSTFIGLKQLWNLPPKD